MTLDIISEDTSMKNENIRNHCLNNDMRSAITDDAEFAAEQYTLLELTCYMTILHAA